MQEPDSDSISVGDGMPTPAPASAEPVARVSASSAPASDRLRPPPPLPQQLSLFGDARFSGSAFLGVSNNGASQASRASLESEPDWLQDAASEAPVSPISPLGVRASLAEPDWLPRIPEPEPELEPEPEPEPAAAREGVCSYVATAAEALTPKSAPSPTTSAVVSFVEELSFERVGRVAMAGALTLLGVAEETRVEAEEAAAEAATEAAVASAAAVAAGHESVIALEAEVLALETNQMRTLGASYAALGMLGWVILTAGDGAMRVLGVRAFACWSAMQQLSLLLSPPSGSIQRASCG